MYKIKQIYNVAKKNPELITRFRSNNGETEYELHANNSYRSVSSMANVENIRWVQAGNLYSIGMIAYHSPDVTYELNAFENYVIYNILKYFHWRHRRMMMPGNMAMAR